MSKERIKRITIDFGRLQDLDYLVSVKLCDENRLVIEGIQSDSKANITYEIIRSDAIDSCILKEELSEGLISGPLKPYVSQQRNSDVNYLTQTVSQNANTAYEYRGSLNEVIADAIVLIEEGNLSDKTLERLVKDVIEYDD